MAECCSCRFYTKVVLLLIIIWYCAVRGFSFFYSSVYMCIFIQKINHNNINNYKKTLI